MARSADVRPDRVDLAGLPALSPLPTAAERAAEAIRGHIFEGRFRPGTALPETSLAQALRVSRNTVREAYRTLINEQLLTYTTHKGVVVRRLVADDVRDIYALRRMLELATIDGLRAGTCSLDQAALAGTLSAGDQAAAGDDWMAAGTANLRFHAELVAAQGSARMDDFFRRLMTEMRLGFLALADPRTFHEPYLRRNHEIADLLRSGDLDRARAGLASYLDDSMRQVIAAIDAGSSDAGSAGETGADGPAGR
jgi:DNA-binding GntR family transcriptional regulator